MKPVRLLVICGGAVLFLLLAAVVLVFNASFQTWGARKALAGRPGLTATLGSLSVGLSRVEVSQLRLESNGAVLTLPALVAELPVVSAAVSDKVRVGLLRAHGWTLDLTRSPALAAAAPGATAPAEAAVAAVTPLFQGAFAQLKLPVDATVNGVDLEGVVILPAMPDQAAARIRVTVRGGGLAAGQDGRFNLALSGAAADGGAFTLRGEFVAVMDTPRTFGRLTATVDAAVSGPRFPQGVKLNARLEAARSPGGETYHLVLTGDGKNLADVQAEFAAAGARLTGRWKLDLHASDLAPFALGRELPVFAIAGEGGFETDVSFAEVHAMGRLQASVDRLAVIRPELAAVGAVTLAADFDVLQHGDSLRVERLNATVTGAKPVLSVHALQSFEFNTRTAGLSVADPAQDLLWLSLQGVPLAWTRPFLGDLTVTGDDLRGEFAASARAGGLTLRSKSPLALNRLGVTRAGAPLLREVNIGATVTGDYAPQGWQVSVSDFSARSGGASLLTLDLKAGQLAGKDQPLKASGHWSANLPAILAQPVAAGPLKLVSGTAEGELTASLGDGAKQFQAKLKLSNLVPETRETLPTVTSDLRAEIDRAGKIAFSVPLLFERAGRKSDLLVAGTLTRAAGGIALDARLTSDLLVAEDVQILAAPLAGPPSAAATPGAAAAAQDVAPFWQGISGQVSLALKKVTYTDQFQVSDVGGTIRVGEGALRLEGVHAGFGADSDLKLTAGVTFTPKAAVPYAMTADLAVLNFDTAPAFRALDPAKLPTIEGRVSLTSRISGDGKNLADLADRARGEMELTSKGGLFRALSSDVADKVQKTQTTVAMIGGFLGTVTRNKDFENINNKAQILTDIAKALAEIPFDQLSVTATRDASLNVVLRDFTLISPEVRLGGSGQITHEDGVPLLAQPLNVELKLAARGRLSDLMKRASLLENKQDSLGYTAFLVPLKIGGTLEKTDTTDLRNALLNSALEKSGLLNTLLGK